ncbi:MAG: hypothetical protein Q7K57_51260 [Burkholderiaceae bacterium]|nr:hypothetical protein [Burkholderiaceae bacterium]
MNNVVVLVLLALWSLPATPLSVTPLETQSIAKMEKKASRLVSPELQHNATSPKAQFLLAQASSEGASADCTRHRCPGADLIPFGEPAPITVILIGLVAGCFIISRRLD